MMMNGQVLRAAATAGLPPGRPVRGRDRLGRVVRRGGIGRAVHPTPGGGPGGGRPFLPDRIADRPAPGQRLRATGGSVHVMLLLI